MITLKHQVDGSEVTIFVPENEDDCRLFRDWVLSNRTDTIALDTETTGLDIFSPGFKLRTVQFGTGREAWVLHWEKGGVFRQSVQYAMDVFSWFLIHNAPFDWLVLDRHAGIPMERLWGLTVDTQILAKLVDPRQRREGGIGSSLEELTRYYIDAEVADTVKASMKTLAKELGVTQSQVWETVPLDSYTYNRYAGMDTILTYRTYYRVREKLQLLGVPQHLMQYEHEIAYIAAYMQRCGVLLDKEYVGDLSTTLLAERDMYAEEARALGVDNVNSTVQVADGLILMGESFPEKTATGQFKVDKSVLLAMADMDLQWNALGIREPNALAMAILRSKRAGKWHSAYVETFLDTADENSRIHPMINTLQARTGRMSITRPALQTLPSSDYMIRRAFLADPGEVMVSVDFMAVEMRVLAALANVNRMKVAIRDGADLHDFTASLVFGPDFTKEHRKLAKGIGFGKVYGGGATTIQRQTGAPMDEVRSALKKYDQVYPEIKRASTVWQAQARDNDYVFVSATGRRLPLDSDRLYAVVNYACQSLARDCLGQSLITMHQQGLLPYLRLMVHDEVLVSAPEDYAEELAHEVKKAMTFDLFGVPIEADAEIGGRSWGSLYGADT